MKILIAVDFSPVGKKVAAEGYRLAVANEWQPVFFTCLPKAEDFFAGYTGFRSPMAVAATAQEEEKKLKEITKTQLEELIALAEKEYGKLTNTQPEIMLGAGNAGDEIIKTAETDKEFKNIIIGYKSHSTLSALLVGSTAAKVARYAPCTVIIFRP